MPSTSKSDNNTMENSSDQSIIGSHLVNLYSQLSSLEKQHDNSFTMDSKYFKSLSDSYESHCLHLKARYKIEEERINRRFESETHGTRASFTAKKADLKEQLLDRLRRKRKLVADEMRSSININSRSFDANPLFDATQAVHPIQTKVYNFRQRPDIGQPTFTLNEDDFLSSSGILSPMFPQQAARKRLVGAFSIFQLPKWTIKDEECEDDLKMILNNRR